MDLKAMMDHRFLLLLSLAYSLIAITSTADSSGKCSAGWENIGKFCYIVDESGKTYEDAEAACENKGMDHSRLASIHGALEQGLIDIKFGASSLGIGLKRNMSGMLTWEDGSTFSYTNWGPSQPSPLYMCVIIFYNVWFMVKCDFDTERHLCKAPADSSGKCLVGWQSLGKFCYIVDARKKKYEEAKVACEKKGMKHSKLASILDAEAEEFVYFKFGSSPLGIGLKRDMTGVFAWEDKSTFIYAKWASRNPLPLKLCGRNSYSGWGMFKCDYGRGRHLCKAPAVN